MYDVVLVRYGEMTLKKRNYRQFQNKINANIKNKLCEFKNLGYAGTDYRFYIHLNGTDYVKIIEKLQTIPGLSSFSPGVSCDANYESMAQEAIKLILYEKKQGTCSFKVETNRSNKMFPAISPEITKEVAGRILSNMEDLVVDVHNPEIILRIDLRHEGTYIYVKSIKGLGGLPAGMSGSGLLMLSGGIDSPVAGFMALKKGLSLSALHFASPPYTSEMALQKVIDISKRLSHYAENGNITLITCPFTDIQKTIYEYIDKQYAVTVMRRIMYRIADILCRRNGIHVIINGESIGQVASQTVESMQVINAVTSLPVIRPLVTFDKTDIVSIARQIGTYDISIRPYEDCCTIFVPAHPIIKPQQKHIDMQEKRYDFEHLITKAADEAKTINISSK